MVFTNLEREIFSFSLQKKPFDICSLVTKCSKKNVKQQWEICGAYILDFVVSSKDCFLLPQIAKIIHSIHLSGVIFPYNYTFYDFEAWLLRNTLSKVFNKVWQKIFGLERNPYITCLQFGSDTYLKSELVPHLVTGHSNADADALFSSFFSWLIAAANRVSNVCNVWNVCGAISSREATIILKNIFGEGVFDSLAVHSDQVTCLAVSLPWKKTVKNDCETISMQASDTLQDVLARSRAYENINVELLIGEGKNQKVLGILETETIKNLQASGFHLSLRDFNDVNEVKVVGKYHIKSLIDHHMPRNLSANFACLIRMSDGQSCSGMLANDLHELILKSTLGHLYVSRKLIHVVSYLLMFAMLDDTDGFDRIVYSDMYSMAKMVAIFDWLNDKSLKRIELCTEILNFKLKDIKHSLIGHRLLSKFFKSFNEIKKLSIQMLVDEAASSDLCVENGIFADTKLQKGLNLITQVKLLEENWQSFTLGVKAIKHKWLTKAGIDSISLPSCLSIIMISTIGSLKKKSAEDQWWIWEPQVVYKGNAVKFLKNFSSSKFANDVKKIIISSGYFGNELDNVVSSIQSFFLKIKVEVDYSNEITPAFILLIKRGALNARKSVVSPYLP